MDRKKLVVKDGTILGKPSKPQVNILARKFKYFFLSNFYEVCEFDEYCNFHEFREWCDFHEFGEYCDFHEFGEISEFDEYCDFGEFGE